MKNNIYEMLNNKEFNFNEYEKLEFNDIEKKKMKKNLSKKIKIKRKKYQKIAVSLLIILTLTGVASSTDIGVQALEKIKGNIDRMLKTEENLEDYKAVLDGSVVDKGIEIKVSEAILDEDKLYIYNQIRSEKKITDDEYYYTSMDAYMNGKKVEFGGHHATGDKIDDYTMENLDSYELKNIDELDLSGDINIEIIYTKAGLTGLGDDPKYIEGIWKFNFETNVEELKNKTKKGEVDCKFTLDNGTEITLDSYKINPLGAVIYGKIENAEHGNPYIIRLKGVDDLGNEYEFNLSGSGDGIHMDMESKKIILESKYIKLTPYAMKFPKNNEKPESEVKVGEEFVIYLK